MVRSVLVFLCIALLATALVGCEPQRRLISRSRAKSVDVERLTTDLRAFEVYFETQVIDAATKIREESKVQREREAAIAWKSIALRQIRDHVLEPVPLDGLLELWAYTERLRDYTSGPEMARHFGTSAPIAAEVASRIAFQAEELARQHVPEQDLPRAAKYVRTQATKYPMRGFFDDTASAKEPPSAKGLASFGDLVTLPLSPLMTFRKVNQTADSIATFNRIAERFSDVVADLPRDFRFQSELVYASVGRSDQITSTIAALDLVAISADRLSRTAADFPAQAGEATTAVLARVRESEAMLHSLLEETRRTAEELRKSIETTGVVTEQGTRLAQETERAAESGRATALAIAGVLEQFDHLMQPRPGTVRPFDIMDYQNTADAVGRGAEEIRALLDELQQAKLPPLATEAEDRARAVIDHAFWRAVQWLGLAIFGGALLILLARFVRGGVTRSGG
jgi:hypothetical protein